MEVHVRAVGWANIVIGVAGFLAAVWTLAQVGVNGLLQLPEYYPVLALLLLISNFLTGVPAAVGGWGLLEFRQWARTLITITSVVNVINVPVGTLVACYSFWTLTQFETEPLFESQIERKRSLRK